MSGNGSGLTMKGNCPFYKPGSVVLRNRLAFALYDRCPVTPGHMLLIPLRHVSDWFETTDEERRDLLALADEARALLLRERRPGGFNLGVNVGHAVGQTVFHVHVHLIPRHDEDVANPRGGVRGVIPEMQNY